MIDSQCRWWSQFVRQVRRYTHVVAFLSITIFIPTIFTAPGAPYRQSPVIGSLEWAPPETIARAASDSDNFPLTWGDDEHLYTAYGDGYGFQRDSDDPKLSLGFARVEGPAAAFQGVDIASNGERVGDGSSGQKASGILMVDGVLYLWVRNANRAGEHCQLAYSTNDAQSWIWVNEWRFEEFGYCTFINYGKNYAGARDNFVYMVSHNHPNAYQGTDEFILTRVPKNAILDREQYEFFVRLENNAPVWSSSIAQRGAVFSYEEGENKARRSGITYNAALGRYLWWHGFINDNPDIKVADSGGFGVYDAPEPWGPWTTVYYTQLWDVGPGDTASFPTKWMSDDGTELYLVFSGDDSFSVRKATLTLR